VVALEPNGSLNDHRAQDIADVETIYSLAGGESGEEDGVKRVVGTKK